ncbi:M48 family metalloprotease [Candidatus Bathyarchaeota archaeon A05DMB-2]|nr:M48 family metalloprotease [Candidatus Bathyarchaeota archaeon A05DMB-2]
MSLQSRSYSIVPEVPRSYIGNLYEFVYRSFLVPQKLRFADISRSVSLGAYSLRYSVLDSSGSRKLMVSVSGVEFITVEIEPLVEGVSEEEILEAKEDVAVAVDLFEQQVRKNSLFFAWREGESVVPESVSSKENKSLRRIFLETQILFIALFMGLGLVLFFLVGPLVAVILLAIQFVFVFYSNKIIARSADWHITEKNPFIHILQYPLSPGDDNPVKKIPKEDLVRLKKAIYEETIAEHGELDCDKAHEIFARFGIDCKRENLIARKVNVYDVVKRTADRFGYKVPEIVVSNTLLPNAAASGPSPSRGVVLITTGIFLQLNDEEIVSVLGHEFGHLRGRDPLWLYGLSAVQYLFWFYVIFGLFPTGSFFLLLIYLWGLTTLTYFIAKFFEARADLISAMVIGKPNVLAGALEKIGFQRLLYERIPSFRVQEWLSMDPHPPIYFRIARLRNLRQGFEIKHPLIQSAKEVTRGFLQSLA